MRVKSLVPLLLLALAVWLLWRLMPWSDLMAWAVAAQRGFQDAMARGLRAVQSGEPAAVWALCSATAAYGFVHALGPGHGKILLGGAALASGATLRRMTWLTLVSSLAQAAMAIAVVGGIAVLLGIGSRQLGQVADDWLAPASYIAIAAIGAYLILRGIRLWPDTSRAHGSGHHHDPHHQHGHGHGHENDHRHAQHHGLNHGPNHGLNQGSDHMQDHGHACCGHAHGPTLQETASLSSLREAALLVGSIAIRPCTGALFLLAIAVRFDMFWIGSLAVLTMGLGTAAFNLLVTWSGVAARRATLVSTLAGGEIRRISAGLHVMGGAMIAALALLWLTRFAL